MYFFAKDSFASFCHMSFSPLSSFPLSFPQFLSYFLLIFYLVSLDCFSIVPFILSILFVLLSPFLVNVLLLLFLLFSIFLLMLDVNGIIYPIVCRQWMSISYLYYVATVLCESVCKCVYNVNKIRKSVSNMKISLPYKWICKADCHTHTQNTYKRETTTLIFSPFYW